jgi:tetratricopeptide (TPR) repeat protein
VYAQDELPWAPAGVAGVVSATLHLTPVAARFRSPEARRLYEQALPLLRQDEQIDSARTLMLRAAAAEPASPLPWAGAAEAEWRQNYLKSTGDWLVRCRESVRRAELRGMDTPEVHSIAGQLETSDGRYTQAIARYERATELPSTNSDAWRRLGDAYRLDHQPDLALDALRKAIAIEPGFYRNHQNLGAWFFGRGDYRAAIPELQTAVRLAPTMPRLRSVLAMALTNVGQFEAAENELRTALSQREDPNVLHSLGQVLMYQSRDRDAIPNFRRAAELDSTLFLSFLYLGNCLRGTGHAAESRAAYARSFALAERQVRDSPQRGYYRAFLAYLCARRGDAQRAEAEIAQALKSSPDNADVIWEAVLTYETLGRRDDAVSVLATAPRGVLEDLSRWPEAAALVRDERFQKLLHAAQRTP